MAEETNGAPTEKKATKLSVLIARHKTERKGKLPDDKEKKQLLATFIASHQRKDAAAEAYQKALQAHEKVCSDTIVAFGDKKLQIGSRLFFPTSKADSAIYREQGKVDPDDVISG